MGSGPFNGKDGVLKIATVAVGQVKNVNLDMTADEIKEYVWGSDKPSVLKSGNKSFAFDADLLYVDSTHMNQVLAGTEVDILVYPEGVLATKQLYTINSAKILRWGYAHPQNGIILSRISGTAMNITPSNQ